jgi:hypothetical protein
MFALGMPVLCTLILAQSGWSASGGLESFTYRDVARSKPPADASPVEWTGSGPSLFVAYERANERRAHRFNVDVASAGSFEYAGPVRRVGAPSGDSAFRFEGRYEYQRRYFRGKFVRGLDIPVGIQGVARRLTMTRNVGGNTQDFETNSLGLGVATGAQFHRWPRWSAELSWVNGLSGVWEHDSYSIDPLSDVHLAGGGWLTDLSVSGRVRIAGHAWLNGSWLQTGEGSYVSHHNYLFSRQRFTVGVTYDR